jgi:hypothetical protein
MIVRPVKIEGFDSHGVVGVAWAITCRRWRGSVRGWSGRPSRLHSMREVVEWFEIHGATRVLVTYGRERLHDPL